MSSAKTAFASKAPCLGSKGYSKSYNWNRFKQCLCRRELICVHAPWPELCCKRGSCGGSSETVRIPWSEAVLSFSTCPMSKVLRWVSAARGDKPPKGPVLHTRAAREECSHCSFILVCFCVSRFCFRAQPWLYIQHFVLLILNSLGIVCRNFLVLSHHGLLDVWFVLFFFFFLNS